MVLRVKVKEKVEEYVAPVGCSHYWIIDSADGPTSNGVCRICGAEKEFFNSFDGTKQAEQNLRPHELPRLPKIKPDAEQSHS